MSSEASLSKRIAKALRDRGAWAVKTHGDPRQRRGLPDILVCYRGQFFGLEVKLPGREGTVTALQQDTLDKIAEADGISAVVTDVDDVQRLLDRYDRLVRGY